MQELVGVILSAKAVDEKKAKSKAVIDARTTIFIICGSPQSNSGLSP
jgi:hypothetical protein